MPKNEASHNDQYDYYQDIKDARSSGSPTAENLDYFVLQLKRQYKRGEKLTFRQWIHKMQIFLDLID